MCDELDEVLASITSAKVFIDQRDVWHNGWGMDRVAKFLARMMMMEWYNEEHHHEGLGFMKPSQVHHGLVEELAAARQETLEAALKAHPERFVKGKVKAPRPPEVVFLNPPLHESTDVKPD